VPVLAAEGRCGWAAQILSVLSARLEPRLTLFWLPWIVRDLAHRRECSQDISIARTHLGPYFHIDGFSLFANP